MTSLQQIRTEVAQLGDAEMRDVCLSILGCVAERLDRANRGLWTLETISAWVGRAADDETLFDSVQYLATQREAKLLEMHFLFFSPEDSTSMGEPIDDQEVRDAYHSGFLVHPETGEEVRSFEEHLLPYFVPVSGLQP